MRHDLPLRVISLSVSHTDWPSRQRRFGHACRRSAYKYRHGKEVAGADVAGLSNDE